jgi:hypothetical protein
MRHDRQGKRQAVGDDGEVAQPCSSSAPNNLGECPNNAGAGGLHLVGLPVEVLELVLAALDSRSLAIAARVCRVFRQVDRTGLRLCDKSAKEALIRQLRCDKAAARWRCVPRARATAGVAAAPRRPALPTPALAGRSGANYPGCPRGNGPGGQRGSGLAAVHWAAVGGALTSSPGHHATFHAPHAAVGLTVSCPRHAPHAARPFGGRPLARTWAPPPPSPPHPPTPPPGPGGTRGWSGCR